jgi:hypothetical protein
MTTYVVPEIPFRVRVENAFGNMLLVYLKKLVLMKIKLIFNSHL